MFPRPITQRNEGQPLHCGIIIDSHLRFARRLFHLKKGQCLFQSVFSFPFISSTGGSDSSMSDGLPMHLIYAPEGLKMVSLSIDKRSSRNN